MFKSQKSNPTNMPRAYTPELKRIMRIGKMPTFNVGPGRPLAVAYNYAAIQHEEVNPAFLSLFFALPGSSLPTWVCAATRLGPIMLQAFSEEILLTDCVANLSGLERPL